METSFLQVTAYQVHPAEEKHELGEMGYPNTLCFGTKKQQENSICNSSKRIQVIKRQTTQASVA